MPLQSSVRRRQKVIVVGGGVAGLTAAHELIERDFEVVLYERRMEFGGKATSKRVAVTDPHGGVIDGLPAEHGFRFFPGWYRHLPDTMGRIPIGGRRDREKERSVLDHLVPTDRNLLVRYGREPMPVVLYSPKSVAQARALVAFARQLVTMGLPARDVSAFLTRLAEFVRTPEEDRERLYDRTSWWDFIEADQRSEAFRALIVATTRTLLAAKAEEASAYTIALLAVRTLFDSPLRSDCVLDGPTSEVWIKPWLLYLQGRGVQLKSGYELDSIHFDGKSPRIGSLSFVRSESAVCRRQLREAGRSHERTSAARLRLMREYSDRNGTNASVRTSEASLESIRSIAVEELKSFAPDDERHTADADFYVFALPAEQMAYYVNRSATMTSYAPSLRRIVQLSTTLDWMAGVQFYFKFPLDIAPGHIVCGDSEWALTAIEQTQFWRDVPLPPGVQAILSVDISAWGQKGRFVRKEAFNCTRHEIATEVWEQIKASFNRSNEPEVLRDEMLIKGTVAGSFSLDDDIVDRYDRKKHAAYARGVDQAIQHAAAVAEGAQALLESAAEHPEAPFVFGDRLEFNAEPLLVNRPGFLQLRPAARTPIENMFLAADYVRTATNLACMEGANEAARHATNAILDTSGSRYPRCKTWSLQDGEALAGMASVLSLVNQWPGAGASLETASGALDTLGGLAGRATDHLKQFWKRP
jgi:uncharacterized protein with NAD-binding domain and iron-sulfur cluster